MNIGGLAKAAEKYVIDNSPRLLTAFGVTGTLTTAYLTAKGAFKAADKLREHEAENDLREIQLPPLDNWDKFKHTWKFYIPAASSGAVTVACIIAANSIGASRLAAMAAAYKLSGKSFEEYKEKVKETLGVKEEKAIRDEINADHVRRNPPSDDIQLMATEDEVVFLEAWTGRYFRSKMHVVKAAENSISRGLIHDNYATLSDFYDELGLKRTQESGEVGWSLENPICLDFTTALADGDSRPVIVMEYSNLPTAIRNYIRMGGKGSEDYLGVH